MSRIIIEVTLGIILIILSFLNASVISLSSRTEHIVDTSNGRIRGSSSTSRSGKTYYQYLGIPYAIPPVGKLRFEVTIRFSIFKSLNQMRL